MDKKPVLGRMRTAAAISSESLARVPLVEIAGQRRVLIENHLGVLAYSLGEIEVKVTYGKLTVLGSDLRLSQMNRDQLVIHGCIDAITLNRR